MTTHLVLMGFAIVGFVATVFSFGLLACAVFHDVRSWVSERRLSHRMDSDAMRRVPLADFRSGSYPRHSEEPYMPLTDDELGLIFRAIEEEESRRERVQERRALHAVRPVGSVSNVVPLRRRAAGGDAA